MTEPAELTPEERQLNLARGYELALAEIRRQWIREGRARPVTDEERALAPRVTP